MPFCPPRLAPYVDHSVVVQRYPQYRPYQHDSDPESYQYHRAPRVSRLLPVPALKLQDPRLECDRNLGWSIDWAVAFLVDHLDPKNSPDAATVLRTVRKRAAVWDTEGHGVEIPFRIFNALNNSLFAGHLKDAVYLDIRKLDPDVSGATHTHGYGHDLKVERISIHLNKDALQQARSRNLVGTLIHHMIHAYFLVACGPQVEKETAYGRLAHGVHFGKIMSAIKSLSALNGRPLTSLDFGHTLGGQTNGFSYNEYYYQQRKPYHRRRAKEKWYCSHCTADVPAVSDSDLDAWYASVCRPLLSLPDTLRSSTVQVYNPLQHFIFAGKPVLVANTHIDAFLSVRCAFDKAGSRYLEIPDGVVDDDVFMRFLELLHTGSYGPDPKHIFALSSRKGPPIIKASTPANPEPYLLTDIKMYKFGAAMGFDELKGTALDRMYCHPITHEDPISLLRELYAAGEPDAELKTWTRKFLSRTPAEEGEWPASTEPSNLAKLECEFLGWKGGFYELLEGSSALKYEVGMAKRELVSCGLYAPGGAYGALQRTVPPGQWVPRAGYLGLPWASEVEMERRAAAAAAAAVEPFLQRGLRWQDDYEDVVSSYGGPY
ncbi:hypothetical protein BU23DRAFT_478690 [Bimuria novae-zelandiae CBS 107.79]|uniref:SprT-like domain-containing protein n=1 Tax=Bimuria novae-zelandiae CBS 107.79 TaxID=1447943 RepID=A0A6A5UYM3_9PLEO|nr:hypothetical protein BU23DRAFT_478690 [Bimuria novae-zelandiae CBS 107.79]